MFIEIKMQASAFGALWIRCRLCNCFLRGWRVLCKGFAIEVLLALCKILFFKSVVLIFILLGDEQTHFNFNKPCDVILFGKLHL